ncbi:MAG: glycosidase, partial [Clostridia bacterium]|nr:glycosidase [Clostridia bacterium]
LTVARSADGVSNWQIDPQPTFPPDPGHHPEELWGVEDPRIVWLEELERYAITYTAFSERGPLVSLTMTKDFRTFERRGPIMPPEDKDSSLFPRRFKGRWLLIHRPMPVTPGAGAHIWVSYSPDLTHWGDHRILLEARQGGWWDARKIGLNTPPIETPEGWLIIYHGVRTTAAGAIYRLGLALLDLDEPTRVISRSDSWVFGPRELYERVGDVADVVFPCGAI